MGAKQDVGGASETKNDDNFDKKECKNESLTEGRTDYAEATDWKLTAASIPQDQFMVSFLSIWCECVYGYDLAVYKVLWKKLVSSQEM